MPLFLRRQIIRAGLKSGADRLQANFKDNAIKYANFFKILPDSGIMLLIQRMDEFEKKYPEYADLMPIRESIYKLNRPKGLQQSIRLPRVQGAERQEIQVFAACSGAKLPADASLVPLPIGISGRMNMLRNTAAKDRKTA